MLPAQVSCGARNCVSVFTDRQPRGYLLTDEQSADDACDQQEIFYSPGNKSDRINQKPGNHKEDRNKQCFSEKLKFGTCWRIARCGIHREASEKSADNVWQLDRRRQHARYCHDAQHYNEVSVLLILDFFEHISANPA